MDLVNRYLSSEQAKHWVKSQMAETTLTETQRKLDQITDPGLFEQLATAILREADWRNQHLVHTGTNLDGKTVRSPVDGITFLGQTNPPRMIAVHHTTCRRQDLEGKWLNDPSPSVTTNDAKSISPAGDLVKTIRLYFQQKKVIPPLEATIILTTTKEPSEELVRKVHTVAHCAGVDVRIWSNSALAHFLDIDPRGQSIRRRFFQIHQELLSLELLQEISEMSLSYAVLHDDRRLWINRGLDLTLYQATNSAMVFLVGESGLGKTVACYRRLAKHIESGGLGLIIPHEILMRSPSLQVAVDATLRSLYPSLVPGAGGEALSLASTNNELMLLLVEDVNRAPQPHALVERLLGWYTRSGNAKKENAWQVLCPIWPRVLTSLSQEARKVIGTILQNATKFSNEEGRKAVMARRLAAGVQTTDLEASSVAKLLGNDPLLIALSAPSRAVVPGRVFGTFLDSSLRTLAADLGEFTAGEYRNALKMFAENQLTHNRIDPDLNDAIRWFSDSPETAVMLRHILHSGEIMRIVERGQQEFVVFRHDRVREWVHAYTLADQMRTNYIPEAVLRDPYLAEVIGAALTHEDVPLSKPAELAVVNPLSLFCAMQYFGDVGTDMRHFVLHSINSWLDCDSTHEANNDVLRWEATRILSDCEGSYVRPLVDRFRKEKNDWWSLRARFRNGDYLAGVALCAQHAPGITVVGHVELIDHVNERFGSTLASTLTRILTRKVLPGSARSGALRLAGYLRNSELANPIADSWNKDNHRDARLADYLWAGAQCCGDEPAPLLEPICEKWGALPDVAEEHGLSSPRDSLASHELRWAFRDRVPKFAIGYLLKRAKSADLRWPITYMVHDWDHADAVEWIARELAQRDRESEGQEYIPLFSHTVMDDWKRQQESSGQSMSGKSRTRLYELWSNQAEDRHLRKRSLEIWCSTLDREDPVTLQEIEATDELWSIALFQRLRRGDQIAIAAMVVELQDDENGYWWQAARYIWSDELTAALDVALERRSVELRREESATERSWIDRILSERLMDLPTATIEDLLCKNWDDLAVKMEYVQVALYAATPRLLELVGRVVKARSDPKCIFEHIMMHFGVRTLGRSGITRFEQVAGLMSYLDYLSEFDIQSLWEECGRNGWIEFRQQQLEERVRSMETRLFIDDNRAMEGLDNMITKWPVHFAHHWTDTFIESGASIDRVMEVVRRWLVRQVDNRALAVAGDILGRVGNRRHNGILSAFGGTVTEDVQSIIDNTVFTVKRRSFV